MSAGAELSVRVVRKVVEAEGVCSLEMVGLGGAALPAFSAGAHVDVHLPGGAVRQYSLCNDPTETHRYLIAVLRHPASRGGSAAVHEAVHEGDELRISAPKNHFALAEGAGRSLLLAGGIGITPLLSMAERLAATGAAFSMHYAAHTRERAAFAQRIRQSAFSDRVHFHFGDGSGGDDDRRLNLAAVLARPQADTHVYVCGPQGFMDAALDTARAAGWGEPQLHREVFGSEAAAPRTGDEPFEVKLASSGRVVVVPAGRTVVQALAEAGVEVMVSCEQGVCGTCLTRVLDGTPDHRDVYLSSDEQAANDSFTPCCSRSKSACLVLDL